MTSQILIQEKIAQTIVNLKVLKESILWQVYDMPSLFRDVSLRRGQLDFLTPPVLGGISAQVCEISPHNSDFL
jgi:hypothetical protein